MAGPWFTVHENGDDWQRLDSIWISNGETDCQGVVEMKIELTSDVTERDTDSEKLKTVAEVAKLQERSEFLRVQLPDSGIEMPSNEILPGD